MSPGDTREVMLPSPQTAGSASALARSATWLVVEPPLVAKPRTYSLGSWTVSDGVRSSATTIDGSCISMPGPRSKPESAFWSRRSMSSMSHTRSLK